MFVKATAISLLLLLGCTVSAMPSEHIRVSGRLHYPENFPLPSDAIATITLTDVSPLQDSSAAMIARQTIEPSGQPVPFALIVDPDKISDRYLYAIQARVASAGRVILTHAAAHPVITQDNPTTVEIYLTPVQDKRSIKKGRQVP